MNFNEAIITLIYKMITDDHHHASSPPCFPEIYELIQIMISVISKYTYWDIL